MCVNNRFEWDIKFIDRGNEQQETIALCRRVFSSTIPALAARAATVIIDAHGNVGSGD